MYGCVQIIAILGITAEQRILPTWCALVVHAQGFSGPWRVEMASGSTTPRIIGKEKWVVESSIHTPVDQWIEKLKKTDEFLLDLANHSGPSSLISGLSVSEDLLGLLTHIHRSPCLVFCHHAWFKLQKIYGQHQIWSNLQPKTSQDAIKFIQC